MIMRGLFQLFDFYEEGKKILTLNSARELRILERCTEHWAYFFWLFKFKSFQTEKNRSYN